MIIDLGDDRYIAGEPPAAPKPGQHWCEWCAGDGLEYDADGELGICMGCSGRCVHDCEDTACPEHSALHPLNADQLDGIACALCGAEPTLMAPFAVGSRGQLFRCADGCPRRAER